MKLKKFIKELVKIEKEHGGNLQVVMADAILVVSPVFSNKYHKDKKVVITDQN